MCDLLASLRERLGQATDPEPLRQEIEAAVVARRDQRGEHTAWALLCERAGLLSLAFSEWQLALRDDLDDPVACFHLAVHYRERGDAARALHLLERLLQARPADERWLRLYVEILVEEQGQPRAEQAIERAVVAGLSQSLAVSLRAMLRPPADRQAPASDRRDDPTGLPTDADCVRFHTLFSGREGVYARQWARRGGQGGYSPIYEPLTPRVIRDHLLGTYTVGVYLVRQDDTATFFALDLDINKAALQRAHGDHRFAQSLRDALNREGPRLVQTLVELGFQPLLENSGYKGRHLWVFLDEPETAETLHLFGRLFLEWQSRLLPPDLHLEYFPKQGRLTGKGLGNLIKLPLGIHRYTGRRSVLLDAAGQAVDDPYATLREVQRTERGVLYTAIEQLKAIVPAVEANASPAAQTAEDSQTREGRAAPPGPPPPPHAPAWTEIDFQADRRMRHLLAECPVLAALKDKASDERRLSHEEQLVLIHTLGHLDGGPLAVNYLLGKCVDVGPEKLMKDRLKGNPVSCPSIRRKIPHVTRRVNCRCPFEFAKDRYPTPVLHLLTLPAGAVIESPPAEHPALMKLAERWSLADQKRREVEREWQTLREAFVTALKAHPERVAECPGGRYRLLEQDGIEELVWEEDQREAASD